MQNNYSAISVPVRKKAAFFFLPAVLLFSSPAAAQDLPSIKWNADTTKIRIGEQVKLNIEVTAPHDAIVQFPEVQFRSDSMEVVERSKIDTSFKKDAAVYRTVYSLTSFEKGHYIVPPLEIKAGDRILSTEPFRIDVATVAVDTLKQARYGIKDIHTDRYTAGELFQKYYWILIVLAIAALLAWEIRRILRRRREKKLPPEMLLSPYERAKFRLNRLDGEKLIEKGLVKDFYIELTDVIRLYLDEQYGIPAPESTSEQTLRDVRKLRLKKEQYTKLRDLLLDADLVKFAKMYPSGSENERYRLYTEEIVETLRPADAPAAGTPASGEPQKRQNEEENGGE